MGRTKGVARESNRIREAEKKRVLDEAARERRARKQLEALEMDNFHEDPHADLVMSKKAPKFQDTPTKSREKKGKRKGPDYFKNKYRKTFAQLVEEDKILRPNGPNYVTSTAPPPNVPPRRFCAVCGYFSNYTCTACGTRYCSIPCLRTHQDTRCLKWTM